MLAELEAQLRRWVERGLITKEQATEIWRDEAAFVATLPPATSAPGPTPPPPVAAAVPRRIPVAAEVVGYIGGGLVLAALISLIGRNADDWSDPAILALLAVPTALVAALGWWFDRSEDDVLRRLGSVLWALMAIGMVSATSFAWFELLTDGNSDTGGALFVGGLTLVPVAATWWRNRAPLQQLALLGAVMIAVFGVVDLATSGDDLSATTVGVVLYGIGVVWFALGMRDLLAPHRLAALCGAALLPLAAQILRTDHDQLGLWLGILTALAVLGIGVATSQTEVLLVGTLAMFQWLPQVIWEYSSDSLGTEIALLLIGLALIGVAVGISRLYPRLRARRLSRGVPAAP